MVQLDKADATAANRDAWNAHRYEAWSAAYGGPAEAAARIMGDPAHVLRRLSPHLSDVAGKRICSVQGSHGRIAIALALSGADATVIDFSEENRRFAMATAEAAGVRIDYVVCDVMEAAALVAGPFDALLLELGVLHYHQDLLAFFRVMRRLAARDGRLVLNEFHPIQRKLFWPDGPHDYFASGLISADVPNPDPAGPSLGTCQYRFWTLGEVVTSAVQAGFLVEWLDEAPDAADPTRPATFTMVCRAG
jgi:SAM-dependent methyltransferase